MLEIILVHVARTMSVFFIEAHLYIFVNSEMFIILKVYKSAC